MIDPGNKIQDQPNSSLSPVLDGLRSQYESAWQAALQGGPPPCLDAFLQQAADLDRPILRAHLASLEHQFQQQLQARMPLINRTLDFEPRAEKSSGLADAEFNEKTLADDGQERKSIPPDTAHDLSQKTLNFSEQAGCAMEPERPAAEPEGEAEKTSEVPKTSEACSQTIGFTPEEPDEDSEDEANSKPALEPQFVQTIDGTAGDGQTSFLGEEKPGPTVPGYKIYSELGRGAMGVVYKAKQKGLNRLVALKMMLAGGHAGAEQLARFHAEAKAVARLQNPNIVQIYDVGEHEGLPYFSLEFVDGGTLHDLLGGKTQPPRDAARMIETLARAMECAHQLGIIHRDLKPANVLVTVNGILKISDFGLAKRLEGEDAGQTRSGTLMGTPSYMSPEQARGDIREIGPPADQYALGAMLYEMLTGRPPFQGASILDTLEQVRTHEPVPPSRLQPTVPRDLETICLRCLQKEIHKRYTTTADLAEDLRRFQAGEPILARPVGKIERAWRWCKRNPKVAGLYAAVAVLVATVGVVLFAMAAHAAQERETIAEASKSAQHRLDEATKSIKAGHYHQARDLLRTSDSLIETNAALAEERAALHRLRDQVDLYAEFKQLSDRARYYNLVTHKDAQATCRKLLALYDQIEQKIGRASCGMPPLDASRQQLLQEEYFEAFLIAAQVEWGSSAEAAVRQKAIALLDRAEKLYPAWILYSRRGFFLEQLGDTKRAQGDLERSRTMRPTSPLDRFWYGMLLHREGDSLKNKDAARAKEKFRQAIQEYAGLLRLRPDHFWAYFDGAVCHFELGTLDEAVIGLTMCTQIRPEAAWPYITRGKILRTQKQLTAAIEDFTRASESEPNNADIWFERGWAHRELGKFDLAVADFDQVLQVNPQFTGAYLPRAEAHRALKNFEKARADYDRAKQVDAKNPAIYFGHGEASLRLQDFAAAHRDWKEAGKLLPNWPEPFHYDAITYKGELKFEEALEAETQAVNCRPMDPSFRLFRAQIHHQQGRFKQAQEELEFVLHKLKDSKPGTFNDYGDLLRTLRRWPESLAAYQTSIKLLPNKADGYFGMALVHLLEGKGDLAEPILKRMIEANSTSFMAYIRRAEFCRARGKWQEGFKDCDQAAKLSPKSTLPPMVRASIRAAHGDFRPAIEEAEAVLKTAPPDGQLLYAACVVWSLASTAARNTGANDLAKQYADRSADLLADAMKKVLDLNYQDYNRMLVDPALAPIRQHPRVLEILPVLRLVQK